MEIRTTDGYFKYGPMHYAQCTVPETIASSDLEQLEQYFTTVTFELPEYTSMYVCSFNTDITPVTVDVAGSVKEAVGAFNKFKQNCIRPPASVVVWDLDETILRADDTVKCSKEVLESWRSHFDYMVLWSNGIADHVSTSLEKLQIDELFDMTISRSLFDTMGSIKPYGLLLKYLNRKFGVPYTTISVLVDDLEDNFNNDYDIFVHCNSDTFDFMAALERIIMNKNSF